MLTAENISLTIRRSDRADRAQLWGGSDNCAHNS